MSKSLEQLQDTITRKEDNMRVVRDILMVVSRPLDATASCKSADLSAPEITAATRTTSGRCWCCCRNQGLNVDLKEPLHKSGCCNRILILDAQHLDLIYTLPPLPSIFASLCNTPWKLFFATATFRFFGRIGKIKFQVL